MVDFLDQNLPDLPANPEDSEPTGSAPTDRGGVIGARGVIVAMSRRIAVDLYTKIVALRPDWHSDDPAAGKIKVVMTGWRRRSYPDGLRSNA